MIYIIPDTNYIKLSHNEKADYTKFYLNKNFDVLFQLQNKKAIESDITIAIPEIVLKELQQQKREAYDEICKKVKMLFHCLGDYGKGEIFVTTEQYDKILDEQIKAFINSNNLIVVPICKKEWFQSIIKRAINKKAPFEGEKSKSDKGFKDVIIWYSLLDYAKEKEGEYIFITNDGAFYKDLEELKREFKEKTGKDIFIYKNYDDVLQHIVIKESEIYIDSVSINYDVREILLKHSESDYSAKLKYIQPRIFTEKEVLSFINIDIKNIYDDALERWNSIDLSRSEFNSNSYMGSMQYIEQYNKNGILSLLFKGEIYSGGPHSTSYQVGRVYRLSTGKPIGLCELLNKDENTILDIFQQKWKEDKKKRGNDVYWDDFQPNYKKVEDIKFYLDSNGIHVFFDIYEAACYAEGVVEFLLFDFEKIVFK